jgi:G3E family GTPase
MQRIESMVRNINDFAEIRRTKFSEVGPDWVLDIDSYYSRQLVELENICKPCASGSRGKSVELRQTGTSGHIANILSTHHFRFPGRVDKAELSKYLDSILYGQRGGGDGSHASSSIREGMIIYRMKGLLHVDGENHLFILQSVHDIFDIYESSYVGGDSSVDHTDGENVVVVIGCHLDKGQLLAGFEAATV